MTPTALEIVNAVAEAYGVTADALRSRSRKAPLCKARAVACFLLTQRLGLTTTKAGRMVQRDHSAVTYYCQQIQGFFKWPKMYAADLAIFEEMENRFFKSNTKPNDNNTNQIEAMDESRG